MCITPGGGGSNPYRNTDVCVGSWLGCMTFEPFSVRTIGHHVPFFDLTLLLFCQATERRAEVVWLRLWYWSIGTPFRAALTGSRRGIPPKYLRNCQTSAAFPAEPPPLVGFASVRHAVTRPAGRADVLAVLPGNGVQSDAHSCHTA